MTESGQLVGGRRWGALDTGPRPYGRASLRSGKTNETQTRRSYCAIVRKARSLAYPADPAVCP